MLRNKKIKRKLIMLCLGSLTLSNVYAGDIEHQYNNAMTLSADNHYLFAGADNHHIYKCDITNHKCQYYGETPGDPTSMTTVDEITYQNNGGTIVKSSEPEIVVLDSHDDLYVGDPDAKKVDTLKKVYDYSGSKYRTYELQGFVWIFKIKGDDNAIYAINKKQGIYRISFDTHSLSYLTPELVLLGENDWWHSRAIYSGEITKDGSFYYLSDHKESDDDPKVNIVRYNPNDPAHSVVNGKTNKNFQFKIPEKFNTHNVWAAGIARDESSGNAYVSLDYSESDSGIYHSMGLIEYFNSNASDPKSTIKEVHKTGISNKAKPIIFNQAAGYAFFGEQNGGIFTVHNTKATGHGEVYDGVHGLAANNEGYGADHIGKSDTYVSSYGGRIYYCNPDHLNKCGKFKQG